MHWRPGRERVYIRNLFFLAADPYEFFMMASNFTWQRGSALDWSWLHALAEKSWHFYWCQMVREESECILTRDRLKFHCLTWINEFFEVPRCFNCIVGVGGRDSLALISRVPPIQRLAFPTLRNARRYAHSRHIKNKALSCMCVLQVVYNEHSTNNNAL